MITLNLLPPERKQYLAQRRRNRITLEAGIGAVVILLLSTTALLGTSILLNSQVASQKADIEQTKDQLKRYTKIEQAIQTIRDRVASLATEEKVRLPWSSIAEDLANAVPEGVQLTQVSFSTSGMPHLQIGGKADNKEKVAVLRERLEFSERFESTIIRQVGQEEEGNLTIATFSIEANLAGVAPPKPVAKPKGIGE